MAALGYLSDKITRKLQKFTTHQFARANAQLPAGRYISFCFDDFPQSAVRNALPLLNQRDWKATWYACGSYMGAVHDIYGPMYTEFDLRNLVRSSHDIGCHTYDHIDCADADCATLLAQSVRNAKFLNDRGVQTVQSFAFPFGSADLQSKQMLSGVAPALRGVHPGINRGDVDLHMLRACGIQADLGGAEAVYDQLEALRNNEGWLIIFTHDVCDAPSPWGCQPGVFKRLLADIAAMDAEILPVGEMVKRLASQGSREAALIA